MKKKMRLGDIVIATEYQVRMKLNDQHVNRYADAMKAGEKFPHMIIEKETNKMVCGFTRYAAKQKIYDPNYLVTVETRTFKSEAERIFFATKDNMDHGQPLEPFDIKNIYQRLMDTKSKGLTIENISQRLGMTPVRLRKLTDQLVLVETGKEERFVEKKIKKKTATSSKLKEISETEEIPEETHQEMPLKRCMVHLRDRGIIISESIYNNIRDHYMDVHTTTLINQVIMRIDDKTINPTNENEMQALHVLATRLKKFLKKKAA
jgi:hypothetical protein